MSIVQEIQAQTAKTRACPRHDFGSWDNRPMFSKLRCPACGFFCNTPAELTQQ